MNQSVSVIVCTYNRARRLERLLQSLARQTIAPEHFELVVVDDGSEDETLSVCDGMKDRLVNLKTVSSGKNRGLSSAANLGIRSSRGARVLFTDDDCVARDDWIEQMCAALDREPIVAGAIASPEGEFYKLCHNIAEFHPFLEGRGTGPVPFIAGANMAFLRPVLEELGGFSPEPEYSPDMELILRAREKGFRVHFTDRAVVLHDPVRTSLGDIFRYSARHAARTIILRNQYRSLLQTPFVLRRPGLIIAASPFIALRVTGGIYLGNPRLLAHLRTAPMVYGLKLAWCWGAARGLRARTRSVEEK